jgi:NADPH:quinone reductase-like Zn-dependent oxidoreductase
MKAALFKEHGGPEKIVYQEVPDPEIGPGEVRVRVKACALNHLDIWVRNGVPAYHTRLPHILGTDVSGIIDQVGAGVETTAGFRPGDRVFIAPGISCFQCAFCLSGQDNLCVNYRIVGAGTDGGYAELVRVPVRNVLPIPDDLSFEEAAAFPLTFLTAWHMLINRARLSPGEELLVLAGGSGIGSAAVQIGKLAGARVIATASTPEKLKRARELGADETINYRQEDFAEAVKKLTGGKGVEVLFEHVGPETFDKSILSLARNGRLVTCGATTGPRTEIDLRYVYSRQLTLYGSMTGTRAELLTLAKLIGQKRLRPIIDSVYPLSEARAAQEKMASRDLFGKIVLKP